ncbi:uncharacterized protein [Ptychodera flava]|uniref:uncharacterized protein n=1 Tax=Ptychodera flava TaxID=63121 RepID=UPI003969FAFF
MDRWSPLLISASLALLFATTSIAQNSFFEMLLQQRFGSGQAEEMLPPVKVGVGEVLDALQIKPCPTGRGFDCLSSGLCFDSFEEICNGKAVCGIQDECSERKDPQGCLNDYARKACNYEHAIQWLTSYGVPNFPQLNDDYDLQTYFDLVFFYHTDFCPDGRIRCHDDCVFYADLCDPQTDHCKCNGYNITTIVDSNHQSQQFVEYQIFRESQERSAHARH